MTRPHQEPDGDPLESHLPGAIDRGIDGILAAAAATGESATAGSPEAASDRIAATSLAQGLTRALFEALRDFPSVQRATLWRTATGPPKGQYGTQPSSPWSHVRSLGSPTPAPAEISGDHWSATGFSVLQAAPFGSLVLQTTPGTDDEQEIFGIECLLNLCSSLSDLEEAIEQPHLEDIGPALPSIDPSRDVPTADPSHGNEPEAWSRESKSYESLPERKDLPESGDTAA